MKKLISIAVVLILNSGCYHSPPSDDEIKSIYLKNSTDFDRVSDICSSHPDLRKITMEFFSVKIYSEKSEMTLNAEEENIFSRIFKNSALDKIRCSWTYKHEIGKLVSVRFSFLGGIPGVPVEVKDLLQDINLSDDFVRDRIDAAEMRTIGVDKWYIYEVK